ncbi:hypothetical protein B0T14DRAFT_186647 [Immersiella caudata]|uniref:Uncharacterized protein n=1 Tax=Immersiella caudata TaxID=314043 RepID=A0AA40C3F9_9PEZI|nr:hypothetical protein B0T14DRAFT_186647 [Immersiella caudata]
MPPRPTDHQRDRRLGRPVREGPKQPNSRGREVGRVGIHLAVKSGAFPVRPTVTLGPEGPDDADCVIKAPSCRRRAQFVLHAASCLGGNGVELWVRNKQMRSRVPAIPQRGPIPVGDLTQWFVIGRGIVQTLLLCLIPPLSGVNLMSVWAGDVIFLGESTRVSPQCGRLRVVVCMASAECKDTSPVVPHIRGSALALVIDVLARCVAKS